MDMGRGAGEKALQTMETVSIRAFRLSGAEGVGGAQKEVGTRLEQTVDGFDQEAKKCALYPGGRGSH